MTNIVLYVAATESDATSGAAELERAGTRLSVVSAVSLETIRKRAPAADCVVFAETPTTAEGAHLLDVVDACGPTPLVLYTEGEYGPTTARATDGITGYVRRDGNRATVHLADEIHWVCHEPERGTAQAPIPIEPSEPDRDADATALPDATPSTRERSAQQDRLEEIERIVDHDLRNQLNLAKGYLTIALETNDLAATAERTDPSHIAEVKAAHDRLTESIDVLLDLSQQRDVITAVEPVGLQDVARRAWARVGETGDRTLHLEDDRLLQADKERVTDMLERLFRSVKSAATSADDSDEVDGIGSLTIRVGTCSDGFFVAVNGGAISEFDALLESDLELAGDREHDFEMVRQITEAHGWAVSIDESDDGGPRIEFTGAGDDETNVLPDSPRELTPKSVYFARNSN